MKRIPCLLLTLFVALAVACGGDQKPKKKKMPTEPSGEARIDREVARIQKEANQTLADIELGVDKLSKRLRGKSATTTKTAAKTEASAKEEAETAAEAEQTAENTVATATRKSLERLEQRIADLERKIENLAVDSDQELEKAETNLQAELDALRAEVDRLLDETVATDTGPETETGTEADETTGDPAPEQ